MANEKSAGSSAGTTYRVAHGSITMGHDALGGRTSVEKGQTLVLSDADAQPLLEVGVIEKA